MAQMHLTPLSEVVDEVWGKTGTKERDICHAFIRHLSYGRMTNVV